MDKIQLTEKWTQVCSLLRSEVSEISFNTWIGSLSPLALIGDGLLYLEVPSNFNKSVVRTRYLPLILNATKTPFERDIEIEFLLPGERVPEMDYVGETRANANFNDKYSFETFVIGSSNRFAHAASLAVAEAPADAYNPLFLYGGVGLGKTHLMHAIGHYVSSQNPDANILYITSENFTNELITAIKNNKNVEFRDRFRSADILLVDDIQFIAGRDSTQEEFFHTFNQLHASGKQIVISSDKPPKEIPTLEERLRSRFEWGLVADIQMPDYETRYAILRKKAELDNYFVPDDVLHFIAEKIDSNIRELEGALTRVHAHSTLHNVPFSLISAQEALTSLLSVREFRQVTPDRIILEVSSFYGISIDDMRSQKRSRDVTLPRQIAMHMIRNMTGTSLPRIGGMFGGRDHTTVMHACDKINSMLLKDKRITIQMDDIKRQLSTQ